MEYIYYANSNYYEYLSSGIVAWQLLLPNNIGLKQGDTVKVLEVDSSGGLTGLYSVGEIRFNGVIDITVTNASQSFYYLINVTNMVLYRVYQALITQSGTGVPTASVLRNDFATAFTFSRTGVGNYKILNTGVFTAGKIFFPTQIIFKGGSGNLYMLNQAIDVNSHNFQTYNGGLANVDNALTATPFQITIFT